MLCISHCLENIFFGSTLNRAGFHLKNQKLILDYNNNNKFDFIICNLHVIRVYFITPYNVIRYLRRNVVGNEKYFNPDLRFVIPKTLSL